MLGLPDLPDVGFDGVGAMQGKVIVIGGGLAGTEAAWQAANQGARVILYEMRPKRMTPAHHTQDLAELVCTNSLGSNLIDSAAGILKEEMRALGSCVIHCADQSGVPAGGALAVDRERFAKLVTETIEGHPNIEVVREEVTEIPAEGPVVAATGPLTSEALSAEIKRLTGSEDLYFYDAAAPILTAESLDEEKGFWGARYGKGGADYFNCLLNKEEYDAFYQALVEAEVHQGHIEEELKFFESCIPIEELAARGKDTMRYGPMRPVGLVDPKTGKRPYAVVQLRKENIGATLLNMVGFQTRLKWGEQKRVFKLIPALANADFVRFGVMHRNTFLNSPKVLRPTYQAKARDDLFFAGQITGVEGYVESAGAGLIAGINAGRLANGKDPLELPLETMLGSLAHYVTHADPDHFQPMNANFGILPPLAERIRDKAERRGAQAKRALAAIVHWREQQGISVRSPADVATT